MKIKVYEVVNLCSVYGRNTTLGELCRIIQEGRIYKCPKCDGAGKLTMKYNAYPSGLPDSGFVYEEGIKTIDCDLCNGEGYTSIKYIPKMVQDGFIPENEV